MNHASLFSGIGGFDLAAEWMGWNNIFQVEIDPFCTKVLEKNFPHVKKYADIKNFTAADYLGRVDILTGGFPCQPFSHAGERRGSEDDRHLWPEMFRVIKAIKPSWIIAENVPGLLTIEQGVVINQVLIELESEGYSNYIDRKGRPRIAPFIIPACAVNAFHRRDRIWIVAHSNSNGKSTIPLDENERQRELVENDANAYSSNVERSKSKQESYGISTRTMAVPELWESRKSLLPKTVLCRSDDGIPSRVDRTKTLGNAIVPQVAYQIFKSLPLNQ